MKAFDAWNKKEYPIPTQFERGVVGIVCEEERRKSWRAVLVCILGMTISSAHCKTELDVLRDWIKRELEEE